MDILDRLLAHNTWTTNRLIELSRTLTDAQLDQEFDIGLRTVRASIDHIIESVEWWTDLMNNAPTRGFERLGANPMTLDGFTKRFDRVTAEFAAIAHQKQSLGQLDEHWQVREDQTTTFSYGTTIVHVLTHSAHHRAQLMYMLKSLGVPDVPMAHALNW